MVVSSGNESIVRYDRERVRGYRIGGAVLFVMAMMIVAFGLDEAAGLSGWWRRAGIFAYYSWYAVPAVILAVKTNRAARAFSEGFVAIGPEGVRLHLLKKKGLTYVLLPEQRLPWQEIAEIRCDGRLCRFRAGGRIYTLSDDNSPAPPAVAQLMAEGKGVTLPAQPLASPEKRPMPRLKQAAILGGTGAALLGIVAAGGWWTYSHFKGPYDGPYYLAEFVTLIVLGLLGFILVATAITLLFVELNHRM